MYNSKVKAFTWVELVSIERVRIEQVGSTLIGLKNVFFLQFLKLLNTNVTDLFDKYMA